jgi:DNA-binding NtrC family response regulator
MRDTGLLQQVFGKGTLAMRQANILLLNFNGSAELCLELRSKLESSANSNLEIKIQACAGVDDFISSQGNSFNRRKLGGLIKRHNPDVIFLILPQRLPDQISELFKSLCKAPESCPVMVVSDAGEPDDLYALLDLGAADFIIPPLDATNILPRIRRMVEQAIRNRTIEYKLKAKIGLKQLIGESRSFRSVVDRLPVVARCDALVLISGETGTGKETCARAIHHLSPRASHPFIPVNCGAIPTELVENEMFGHERGTFTDASQTQHGLICEADGGTLFLDEIDCLPAPAQVKLLRFLQEKEYRPLGSTKTQRADVRVIAASNENLEEAVQSGKLRRDLYYRLNVIPLRLPPLRERREDIPMLAAHFLTKYAAAFGKPPMSLSPEAMQPLKLHDWPGNVRELEHIIERAVALSTTSQIQISDLDLPGDHPCCDQESFREAKARHMTNFERTYIQELLITHQGNISRSASAAHKHRRAFWQLIRKHGIDVRKFKSDLTSREVE